MYLCLFWYIWWHKVVFKRLGPDQKTQNAGVKNLLRGKYKLQHFKLYVMLISYLDWQHLKLDVILILYLDWREKGLRAQLDLRWVRILTSLMQTLSILEIRDSIVFLSFVLCSLCRLLRFTFCPLRLSPLWISLSLISLSDSLHYGAVLSLSLSLPADSLHYGALSYIIFISLISLSFIYLSLISVSHIPLSLIYHSLSQTLSIMEPSLQPVGRLSCPRWDRQQKILKKVTLAAKDPKKGEIGSK